MSAIAMTKLILPLTIGAISVAAMPFNVDGGVDGIPVSSRNAACRDDAITSCTSGASLDGPTCFALVCLLEADLKAVKRQDDRCNEENLPTWTSAGPDTTGNRVDGTRVYGVVPSYLALPPLSAGFAESLIDSFNAVENRGVSD
ncbi:hypothetical protein DL768_009776 [Monosporascus sp. mg162]|nr:hypothetical protein DL768_009776 [Monosporascus sp. mg162]